MNNESLNRKARELRRVEGQASLAAFAKFYFPHYVRLSPSVAHKELYDLLEEASRKRGQKIAFAAPRGFGKTTMITTIYVLHGICYREEQFIVILSAAMPQAALILEAVKRELRENQKLLGDFPTVAWPRSRPWKEKDITTPNGIRVIARGSGQQVRGQKHGAVRPTLVIMDDLETVKTRFSPERRDELKDWFNQTVMKLGDQQTNYLLLGTLYHPQSLLAEYTEPNAHPLWQSRVLKAIITWSSHPELWAQWRRIFHGKELYQDIRGHKASTRFYEDNKTLMDEGVNLLWPERYSYLELMELYEDDPVSFNCEYQNEPINPRDCLLNVLEFVYWDDQYSSLDELIRALGPRNVEFYGACDPSMAKKSTSDYTAIVIIIKDTRDDTYYVVTADIARRKPDAVIEAILSYQEQFRFVRFGIEANGFQELFVKQIEDRAAEKGIRLTLEPVQNTQEKHGRILTLQPLLKSGKLKPRRLDTQLLNECRSFPGGRYDDGLDALAMAVQLANDTISRAPIRFL